jgi:hypothetical protein
LRLSLLLAAVVSCKGTPPEQPSPQKRDAGIAPALPIPQQAFDASPPADAIVDLGEGRNWVCATRKSGHVDCWGDGSTIERLPDIDDALAVRGADFERCVLRRSGITCFDLGYDPKVRHFHLRGAIAVYPGYPSCALRADHRVECWDERRAPKLVPSLRDVVAMSGNGYLTCAVHSDGKVSCSDDLASTYKWRHTPLAHVKLLALGEGGADNGDVYTNACAILDDGTPHCYELSGHTGKRIHLADWQPAPLDGVRGATQIVMKETMLIALVGGKVVELREAARTLPKLADAVAITSSCALRAQGSVVCWGEHELGQPSAGPAVRPTPVVGVNDVVSVAAGERTTWAVTRDGRVFHWGGGEVGWAVPLEGAQGVAAVAIGPSSIDVPCFLRRNGRVTCLGYRDATPVDIGLEHVVELTAPSQFLARLENGQLKSWMSISIGSGELELTDVPAISGAVETTGDLALICGRFTTGVVRCDQPTCERAQRRWECKAGPQDVVAIPPARTIAVNGRSACAVAPTGEVWCWGRNDFGELGTGSADDQPHGPTKSSVTGAVAIGATEIGFCAAGRDGSLTCWGTRELEKQPKQFLPPGSVEGPFSGGQDGCAIREDGLVACWGSNAYGRLGDGSVMKLDSPAAVPGLQ